MVNRVFVVMTAFRLQLEYGQSFKMQNLMKLCFFNINGKLEIALLSEICIHAILEGLELNIIVCSMMSDFMSNCQLTRILFLRHEFTNFIFLYNQWRVARRNNLFSRNVRFITAFVFKA